MLPSVASRMKDLFDISGRGAMVTESLVLDSISESLKIS